MYYNVESINLKSNYETNEVRKFLEKFSLKYEDVDYTVVIRENDDIIATCSKKENILKCFAISENYQGLGLSNNLISKVTEKLFLEGRYHSFIFTKPENQFLFEGLGYKNIFTTDKVSLLESGNKNINASLDKLKKEYKIDDSKEYAALVMNCNPFTLGHRYIIESACKSNENVIIFVVEEDKSVFPFKSRFKLIKEGTKDLENVTVVPAGEYIISSATFPNYFLKKNDDALKEYTKLDCNIFGKYFVPKFNIKKRFVGSEPHCEVTNMYNETIQEVLPKYNVQVELIKRKEIENDAISASRVRKLLKDVKFDQVKELVPKTTFDFLLSEEGELVISKL
ncbi:MULTISPECIES: [citrate (pro-3S)-lyase] ligase [unclassified Romboutsia]|uniref:[citrate (pro-3S)-lyase] ligase n=1 Tax=unclassified Romboutsia TaxID=2626894 RepID=UPI0008233500|nr:MULTISPECIES: [citrate (pro-3S)-lyase] ligase [unclassified Romboutsia]SCH71641.1 [Citrate [pro-3S]-lyase] ligase [uncultured Clostridium sp.]